MSAFCLIAGRFMTSLSSVGMRPDDFFTDGYLDGPWGRPEKVLDDSLLDRLRTGRSESKTDLEAAVALARLAHNEFKERGTSDNPRLTVEESREVLNSLRAVLARLGVEFDPPFLDFDEFYDYWVRQGASGAGGWAARRAILADLFNPIHERLADLEANEAGNELAEAVSPRPRTGWTQVDDEIAELRRHFRAAQSPQDYRNVGNDCVAVLERLSATAYLPERHLQEGEAEPPVASTKARLSRVVEVDLVDRSNAELRKLVRAAIEQAQAVKHRTPDRKQAGIAADSVIMLTNIFRRLAEPD